MTRILLLILSTFLYTISLYALRVSASVDKKEMFEDEVIIYTITIEGKITDIKIKSLGISDFQVIDTSSTSQTTIINGNISTSKGFIYYLRPLKTGTLQIGPTVVKVGGKSYKTTPIRIKVYARKNSFSGKNNVSGSRKNSGNLSDYLFLRIDTDKTNAYINQQIVLNIKLYFRNINLASVEVPRVELKNFIVKPITEQGRAERSSVIIKGQRFNCLSIRKAIYPIKSGKLTIGPARMKVQIKIRTKRRHSFFNDPFFDDFDSFFDDFFGRTKLYNINLSSNIINLNIKDLPEGAPSYFKGAVGKYTMQVSLDPDPGTIKLGDPINLQIVIKGEGDVSSVQMPDVLNQDKFKTYDPEEDIREERGTTYRGIKIFKQLFIPRDIGKVKLGPIRFCYFDPEKKRYIQIQKGPFEFIVVGKKEQQILVEAPLRKKTKSIKYLKKDILPLHSISSATEELPLMVRKKYLLSYIGGVLLIPIICFIISTRYYRIKDDPHYRRRLYAYKNAIRFVGKAEKALKEQKAKEFYENILEGLKTGLADRLLKPKGSISINILEEIKDSVGEKNYQSLKELFSICEESIFSGSYQNIERNNQLLKEAKKLIKVICKKL